MYDFIIIIIIIIINIYISNLLILSRELYILLFFNLLGLNFNSLIEVDLCKLLTNFFS